MKFSERTTLGLIHHIDNQSCVAGHKRMFGKNGMEGWSFYKYAKQGSDWALHRVWDFKLFCIHHVGDGLHVNKKGWGFTYCKLEVSRIHNGLTIKWRWADNFRIK